MSLDVNYSVHERNLFIIKRTGFWLLNDMFFIHYREQLRKYESDKNCLSKSHIFTAAPNKAVHNKRLKSNSSNHEYMCHFNNELTAGLQDFYNNYAYAGILLK